MISKISISSNFTPSASMRFSSLPSQYSMTMNAMSPTSPYS